MTTLATAAAPTRRAQLSRAGRRQGLAMSGQLVAGAGNLVVSAVLARLLLPAGYAAFVAFLAGYVLMHTVASSVTAAVAMDPGLAPRLFRRSLTIGLGVGGLLAVASPAIAQGLGIPVPAVLLLAAAAPSATLLALARGALFGRQRTGGTVATLCVEPLVRGLVGLALVPLLGPTGAALAVVTAGYAALAIATLAGRGGPAAGAPARAAEAPPALKLTAVTLTFLLVGVVAAQDVMIANRILSGQQAGVVAAIATIGGAAYFATATVPMVLMPSGRQQQGSLLVALTAAAAMSLAAVVVVGLIPAGWYATALGNGYRGVDDHVVPYVGAMAALGIAKVLLAQLCLVGRSRLAGALVALAVATQLALLLTASSVADVVWATGVACSALLIASAVATALSRSAGQPALATALLAPPTVLAEAGAAVPETRAAAAAAIAGPGWRQRLFPLWPLGLALLVGLLLRLVVLRSIWVDEAISIQQAQLPYLEMISTLRANDVHPPLFASVLWALVHVTGSTAEWVVRLPSLLAGMAFIVVIYAMARDLWDRRTARITGFVTALAPIAVWYAQEARMYSMWMLFATVAVWSQIRILRALTDDTDSRPGSSGISGATVNWAAFLLSTVALLYLHWFSVLPLIVQHAVFAVQLLRGRQRGLARPWLGSIVATLALFAPLVPYLLQQSAAVLSASGANEAPAQTGSAASAASGDVPDIYAVVANTIWALWGYHDDQAMVQLSALWPLGLLACFAALGRSRTRHETLLVLVAVVPAFVLFVMGFEKRIYFEVRYFTAAVPMLLLLLSRLAATWGRGPLTRLVLPLLVLASLGGGLVDQQVNQSNPRTYDFRGAVAWVRANGDSDDVVLYAPGFLKHELAYYPTGMTTLDADAVKLDATTTGMPSLPAEGRSVFVFGSFLNEEDVAAQVGTKLAHLEASGAQQVAVHKVPNVTIWQFKETPR